MTDDTRKTLWRDALLWAIVAAMLLEFVVNVFEQKTLWQRMDGVEHRIEHLEKIHEQQDEDMRRRLERENK